jgi:PhoH-like ATPase
MFGKAIPLNFENSPRFSQLTEKEHQMDKKLFIVDTNVLMHDPAAIFRFKGNDVFLPMIVLEELDHNKKGTTEVARNARQASRFLDELIKNADLAAVNDGIPLSQIAHAGRIDEKCGGRLFLQTKLTDHTGVNDNGILATVLSLSKERLDTQVILVSKDINMRIKAFALGIKAEDYSSDEVVDDINLLYSGVAELPSDFWETHKQEEIRAQKDALCGQRVFYKVSGPLVSGWYPNQFLYLKKDKLDMIVRTRENDSAVLEVARSFRTSPHGVWGIQARNREQNFALNALLDPEIDFVTLLGVAGTGKTLLTLASALMQIFDKKQYTEVIFTRETVSVGEDIGFLPGTEEEKMMPWMGALMDNLELFSRKNVGKNGTTANDGEQDITKKLITRHIKIRSLNFMRGRTFLNRFVIVDEAQNLTPKQAKTLVTRAGPGTKMVCMGNLGQIDSPYLSATTSGLASLVERFRPWAHAAHITLCKGERSRLADFANENL